MACRHPLGCSVGSWCEGRGCAYITPPRLRVRVKAWREPNQDGWMRPVFSSVPKMKSVAHDPERFARFSMQD